LLVIFNYSSSRIKEEEFGVIFALFALIMYLY